MKLFYFTYCYPYGMGEQWKANELNELVRFFEEITVVPFFYGGNFDNPKKLPDGIKLLGPLFKEMEPEKKQSLWRLILHRNMPDFFREFVAKRVFLNKGKLVSWLNGTRHAVRVLRNPVMQNIIKSGDKETVLYFYWGKGSSEILPFINTEKFKRTFVRMHRFDLFEYVNNNYIPYRGRLMNKISVAAPSSFAGKEHLLQNYPGARAKIEEFRCGTIDNGKLSSYSTDNVLRVMSCSGLSAVKRVHLMIESLQYVDFPIIWTHLGDGSLSHELKELSRKLHVEERFVFKGMIQSEKVLDFYTDNTIDLFINTSSSEGVPFSIMEALSAGIPVMATDVGGTGELVDKEVGNLLPAEVTPRQLAQHLKSFYELSLQEKIALRKQAHERYANFWNAKKLATELGSFLVS
jgi:glycosyltransferase involved in cell wall biosynthesis